MHIQILTSVVTIHDFETRTGRIRLSQYPRQTSHLQSTSSNCIKLIFFSWINIPNQEFPFSGTDIREIKGLTRPWTPSFNAYDKTWCQKTVYRLYNWQRHVISCLFSILSMKLNHHGQTADFHPSNHETPILGNGCDSLSQVHIVSKVNTLEVPFYYTTCINGPCLWINQI